MDEIEFILIALLVAVVALASTALAAHLPYPIVLVRLRAEGTISAEVMRTLERELDLEDQRLDI